MIKEVKNISSSLNNQGVLNKLPPEKLNLLIGEVTSLMMLSKVHRKMQIRDIADIILHRLTLISSAFIEIQKKEQLDLFTWGWFDDKTEQKYLSGNVVLTAEEWNSGKNLFFTDFIAPFGHTKKIFKDLTYNIFPNETAKTLRFDDHGKPRSKPIILYGKNRII